MDIGFYIADLLQDRDEVSLPGLGTFTKERLAGSYDLASNSFIPPSYQVLFNDQQSDFHSLPEYISIKKNLSLPSAEYFVKKFATGIFDLLQTSGIAEIKPLGIFRQKNETLSFEVSTNFDIGGRFYGLKPVSEIADPKTVAVESTTIHQEKESFIEDFITNKDEDLIEDEEVYAEEPKSKRTLLIAAGTFFFVFLAAALLYVFNPATRNLVNGLLLPHPSGVSVPKAKKSADPVVSVDSINISRQSNTADSTAPDSSKRTPAENTPKVVETTTFEIIGAAFGKRGEAERYIKSMKAKGLQARILEDMPGPLFKVSLASFSDYQSAQNELNRIKKEVEETAWTTPYKSKKIQ